MKTYLKPEVECVVFSTEEITLDPLNDDGYVDTSTGVETRPPSETKPINPFG